MPLQRIGVLKIPEVGNIIISSDIERLKKGINKLSRTGIPRAVTRAINKSLLKTRTQARKGLAKKFNLPAKVINPTITHKNAVRSNGTAYIQGRSGRIPIIKVKGSKTQKRAGVSINTGTGRRVIKHTFLATMQSGHTGVFKRTGATRSRKVSRVSPSTGKTYQTHLPIRELSFPPSSHMLTNRRVAAPLFDFYTKDYPVQLRRQLNAEFDKAKGAG